MIFDTFRDKGIYKQWKAQESEKRADRLAAENKKLRLAIEETRKKQIEPEAKK